MLKIFCLRGKCERLLCVFPFDGIKSYSFNFGKRYKLIIMNICEYSAVSFGR